MQEKTLDALFAQDLRQMYFAERRIAAALFDMARLAPTAELRSAFDTHARETEGQIERLETIFDGLGETPTEIPFDGIVALLKDGQARLAEFAGGEAFEAALIGAGQAIEHYEIARYNALRRAALRIGLTEAVELIEESLEEEADMDEILTEIAEAGADNVTV
jgi:ferritin-like metal-binding protein YciE